MYTVTNGMLRRMIVIVVCVALPASGCASARWNRTAPSASSMEGPQVDRAVLSEYVQRLPPGTGVRVDRAGGKTLRGTLIKASAESIVVQPKTRIPEPAVEIPLNELLRVVPETTNGSNLGKAIGIGVAAGAGAALGVFLLILAMFAD